MGLDTVFLVAFCLRLLVAFNLVLTFPAASWCLRFPPLAGSFLGFFLSTPPSCSRFLSASSRLANLPLYFFAPKCRTKYLYRKFKALGNGIFSLVHSCLQPCFIAFWTVACVGVSIFPSPNTISLVSKSWEARACTSSHFLSEQLSFSIRSWSGGVFFSAVLSAPV